MRMLHDLPCRVPPRALDTSGAQASRRRSAIVDHRPAVVAAAVVVAVALVAGSGGGRRGRPDDGLRRWQRGGRGLARDEQRPGHLPEVLAQPPLGLVQLERVGVLGEHRTLAPAEPVEPRRGRGARRRRRRGGGRRGRLLPLPPRRRGMPAHGGLGLLEPGAVHDAEARSALVKGALGRKLGGVIVTVTIHRHNRLDKIVVRPSAQAARAHPMGEARQIALVLHVSATPGKRGREDSPAR